MKEAPPRAGVPGAASPRPRSKSPRPPARRGQRAEVAVVTAVHVYAAWWTLRVTKFPKDLKHALGQRSLDLVLELLETLVEAAYLPAAERRPLLAAANRMVERLRHLARLAHATAALPHESYGHAAEQLDDIGRQVGAWLRSERAGAADAA